MGIISSVYTGYNHVQASASTTWVINHNLENTSPVVDCWIDNGGDKTKIMPQDVTVTDANTCTVTFSTVQSGEAFIT